MKKPRNVDPVTHEKCTDPAKGKIKFLLKGGKEIVVQASERDAKKEADLAVVQTFLNKN
jgi:hypothetical protein